MSTLAFSVHGFERQSILQLLRQCKSCDFAVRASQNHKNQAGKDLKDHLIQPFLTE